MSATDNDPTPHPYPTNFGHDAISGPRQKPPAASPPNVWLCAPADTSDADPPGPLWASRAIDAFTQPGDRVIVRSLGGYPSLPGEVAALIAAAARAGRHPIALLPTPAAAARTRALLPALLPPPPPTAPDWAHAPHPRRTPTAGTACPSTDHPAGAVGDPVATDAATTATDAATETTDMATDMASGGVATPDTAATVAAGMATLATDAATALAPGVSMATGARAGEGTSRAGADAASGPDSEPATVPLPIGPATPLMPEDPSTAHQIGHLVADAVSGRMMLDAYPRPGRPKMVIDPHCDITNQPAGGDSGGGPGGDVGRDCGDRSGVGWGLDPWMGPAAPMVPVGRVRVGVGRRRPAREAGPATAVIVLAGPVAPGARPPRRGGLSARVLAAWARPLRPGGVLAVLSPPPIGRPVRARSTPLAAAAREAGLSYAEHIVLVHTATGADGLRRPESTRRPHAPFWPVHTDLFVLIAQGEPR